MTTRHNHSTSTATLPKSDTYQAASQPTDEAAAEEPVMDRTINRYVHTRTLAGELTPKAAVGTRNILRSFSGRYPQLEPAKITRRHVETWMQIADRRPGYRRRRLSVMRVFSRWLVAEGVLKVDPTFGVRPPPQPVYMPRNLTHEEVAATLAATAHDPRARVIVLLTVQEGLRCCEIARAEVGDIDWHRKAVGVRGKGGHQQITRTVPLSDQTLLALDAYRDSGMMAGPLVRSLRDPDRGISAAHIGDIYTRIMYQAGVKRGPRDGRSAHAGRHTCAVDMLDQGADILEVRDALGHRALSSTMVYASGYQPRLRKAMGGRAY